MNKPFQVIFQYDESTKLWDVFVRGATSPLEAVQGFNAVVITARDATPSIETNRATMNRCGDYEIGIGLLPL